MPTAQARFTQTRGLHATRSSIRSDNGPSSLPERSVARRFFLFRWHRAHTCHPLNSRTATSADRSSPGSQFPGASDLRALPWAYVRVRGAAGRGCHLPAWLGRARFARSSYVNRALFGIWTAADRWPGSQARMTCSSYHGYTCASGEPLGAAGTRRLRWESLPLRAPPM